eukprot:1153075-Rhodomonas_salina.1
MRERGGWHACWEAARGSCEASSGHVAVRARAESPGLRTAVGVGWRKWGGEGFGRTWRFGFGCEIEGVKARARKL